MSCVTISQSCGENLVNSEREAWRVVSGRPVSSNYFTRGGRRAARGRDRDSSNTPSFETANSKAIIDLAQSSNLS